MTGPHSPSSVFEAANTSERKIIPSVAADTARPQAGKALVRVLGGRGIIRTVDRFIKTGDLLDGSCSSTRSEPLSDLLA